jgi:hypothetical protein
MKCGVLGTLKQVVYIAIIVLLKDEVIYSFYFPRLVRDLGCCDFKFSIFIPNRMIIVWNLRLSPW